MTMIELVCPACEHSMGVLEDTEQDAFNCPECGHEIQFRYPAECPQCHEKTDDGDFIKSHGMCRECHKKWQFNGLDWPMIEVDWLGRHLPDRSWED